MNWRLINDTCHGPQIQERDDEDLTVGYSFLRLLARKSNDVTEVRPGVFLCGDQDGARALLEQHDRFLEALKTQDQ